MSWLTHLQPAWNKQAHDQPFEGGDGMGTSPAPNYRRAEDPAQSCDSCGFQDKKQNYCTKYKFVDDPTYVCDSWQPLDLNLDRLKFGFEQELGEVDQAGGANAPHHVLSRLEKGLRKHYAKLGKKPREIEKNVRMDIGVPEYWKKKAVFDPAATGMMGQNSAASGIKPLPLIDGSRPKAGRPQAPLPPGHPAQPQLPTGARRPSVVAEVGRAQGGPQAIMANIQNMFNQPMKTASDPLAEMYIKRSVNKPSKGLSSIKLANAPADTSEAGPDSSTASTRAQSGWQGLPGWAPSPTSTHPVGHHLLKCVLERCRRKTAAVHATGDDLPHDWNHTSVEPSKTNGGMASYGREAWNSFNQYRRKGSDKNNFDKAWHMRGAKKASELGKLAADLPKPVPPAPIRAKPLVQPTSRPFQMSTDGSMRPIMAPPQTPAPAVTDTPGNRMAISVGTAPVRGSPGWYAALQNKHFMQQGQPRPVPLWGGSASYPQAQQRTPQPQQRPMPTQQRPMQKLKAR